MQKTIAREIEIEGVGIHNGQYGVIRLRPAGVNHGIRFIHAQNKDAIIVGSVVPIAAPHATVLSNGVWALSTVEHLMAALAITGIDNLDIICDAAEIPILDGSALPFVIHIQEAGIVVQGEKKNYIMPRERIRICEGDSRVIQLDPLEWGESITLSYTRDLSLQQGGLESNMTIDKEKFEHEIAPARTFGQLKQLAYLHAHNLALGTTLANTLVIDNDGSLNTPRFSDECMRHKMLDLVGDLALLGAPLHAKITASNTGHSFNRLVIQHMREHPDLWTYRS